MDLTFKKKKKSMKNIAEIMYQYLLISTVIDKYSFSFR